jgi:hypothetical protein
MKIQKKISIFIVLLGLGLASATLSNYINIGGSTTLNSSVIPMTSVNLSSVTDSYIEEEDIIANHGSGVTLYVKSKELGNERSLIRFDLSGIPVNATIESAHLYLYYYDFDFQNTSGRTYWAYKISSTWVENEVTWIDGKNSSAWTSPGGDYTTDGASIVIPSSFGWVNWNVTDIVIDWINGEDNNGFLIKDDYENELESRSKFRSKDYTGTEFDPYLEVVYSGG